MPHRDPQTGQFVSDNSNSMGYDDIEVVSATGAFTVAAAQLDGSTGQGYGQASEFEGVEIVDYDEVVDRNESLVLLSASHRLTVSGVSTSTADGTVRAEIEVSASPSLQAASEVVLDGGVADVTGDFNIGNGGQTFDDSIDVLGRPLLAIGTSPFSDGGSGVGGAGTAGEDSVELRNPPGAMAEFHPRDELFVNGVIEASNVSDASITVEYSVQHIYGVVEG